MSILSNLDRMHARVRENRWHQLFSIFCRVSLAAGFLPSGYVKIVGERFTDLAVNHPMGHNKPNACYDFCECIHTNGRPINECLEVYNKAPAEVVQGSESPDS